MKEGFWPKTNWKWDYLKRMNALSIRGDADITLKDEEEPYPYCGPAKERPCVVSNPYRDSLLND